MEHRPSIAILVPELGAVGLPEDRPLGRAALLALTEEIPVVFATDTAAGRAHGVIARPGRWEPARDVPVAAVYDRFPCQSQPERHARLLAGLPSLPVANPPSLVRLCRDKLASQRALESSVRMPEVEGDPMAFPERLQAWGTAFLKPRHGSFGRGVRWLQATEPLPAVSESMMVLQRAVLPPGGRAGLCIRVLVQRERGGDFCAPWPVLRSSLTDPVVNAARGAEVSPLQEALPEVYAEVVELGLATARALAALPDGSDLVEVGVDIVLDPDHVPYVVEVNGRPRGRLEVLASKDALHWLPLHTQTCLAPIRWLWTRYGAAPAPRGCG